MRARSLPAFVLLVGLLAVLPIQAWASIGRRDVRVTRLSPDLVRTQWWGALQPDGALAVRIRHTLSPEGVAARAADPGTTYLRVPEGAVHVAVDDRPVKVQGSSTQVRVTGTSLELTFDLPGAAVREGDQVSLDATLLPSASGLVGYGNAEVQGVLFFDRAVDPGTVRWLAPPLSSVRAEADPGLIRFSAVWSTSDDVTLLATLPATAAPGAGDLAAARIDGEPRASATDREQELTAGFGADGRPSTADRTLRTVIAVLLTVEVAGLVLWGVRRFGRNLRDHRRSLAGVPDELRQAPSGLAPDIVGFLVGGRGPGERSIVAGTLLDLAQRRVIRIEGLDAERFKVVVPAGATGQNEAEATLLRALRPLGRSDVAVELTGPPLWGSGPFPWTRTYLADVERRARSFGLHTATLSVAVLIPLATLPGLTAWILGRPTNPFAVVMTFVGPLLGGVASITSGFSLTRRGRRERAEWLAFGNFIRTTGDFEHVGVPGIVTWGEYLTYGVVVGACPKVAADLSPRSQR